MIMRMHYAIRLVAGSFVLISLALGYWVSPYWLLFTAFVGVNLIQSAFTHWCLMEKILVRLGLVRNEWATAAPGSSHHPPRSTVR